MRFIGPAEAAHQHPNGAAGAHRHVTTGGCLPFGSLPVRRIVALTRARDSIAVPDSAGGRRALQSPARVRHGLAPKFSQEWVNHCRAKYTSFNPKTGMYRSYNGVTRPCR